MQLFKAAEDELEALRHDALAGCVNLTEYSHAVCLSSTRLPIDKVCAIVAVKNVHDKR